MWYVIHVPTGKEEIIKEVCIERLSSSIYKDIFVLRYTRKMKLGGKWQNVVKTLFPGYLFVDTDNIMQVKLELNAIKVMTNVLGADNDPVPISIEEQEFLQSLIDDAYIVRMSSGFIIGDQIALTEGPLKNTKGIIKKINRHKREAEIDVNLFGTITSAVVGLEVVRKVTAEEFERMRDTDNGAQSEIHEEVNNAANKQDENTVRILSGVFKGMTGKLLTSYEEADSSDEVEIELEVFDSPAKVVMKRDSIMIR